jgi:hypothetical protein
VLWIQSAVTRGRSSLARTAVVRTGKSKNGQARRKIAIRRTAAPVRNHVTSWHGIPYLLVNFGKCLIVALTAVFGDTVISKRSQMISRIQELPAIKNCPLDPSNAHN